MSSREREIRQREDMAAKGAVQSELAQAVKGQASAGINPPLAGNPKQQDEQLAAKQRPCPKEAPQPSDEDQRAEAQVQKQMAISRG